jgi:hypothetical protein
MVRLYVELFYFTARSARYVNARVRSFGYSVRVEDSSGSLDAFDLVIACINVNYGACGWGEFRIS